jgi:hypothetical protein
LVPTSERQPFITAQHCKPFLTRHTQIAGDFMTAQYTHLMEKRGIEVVPANMVASKAVVGESEAPVWKKKSSYPTVTTSYRKFLNDEVLRDLQVTVTRISEKRFHKPYVGAAEHDWGLMRLCVACSPDPHNCPCPFFSSLNNTPTSLYEFPNGYNCNWGLERCVWLLGCGWDEAPYR